MDPSAQVRPLKFDVIRCTSCDRAFPATNLQTRSTLQQGWVSERFCDFPQRLVFKFQNIFRVHKLDIVSHETLIPSQVEVFVASDLNDSNTSDGQGKLATNPSGEEDGGKKDDREDSELSKGEDCWQRLGHITFSSSEGRTSIAREMRSVFLDVNCQYIRLDLQRPHLGGSDNLFGQVSICNFVPHGTVAAKARIEKKLEQGQQNSVKSSSDGAIGGLTGHINDNSDESSSTNALDPETLAVLSDLVLLKQEAIQREDYHSARDIKRAEQQVRAAGANIARLQTEKTIAIESEQFDRAAQIKAEIDRLKLFIEQQPMSLRPYQRLLAERAEKEQREKVLRKKEYGRRYRWDDGEAVQSLAEFTGNAEQNALGDKAASTIQRHLRGRIKKRENAPAKQEDSSIENPGKRPQFEPMIKPSADPVYYPVSSIPKAENVALANKNQDKDQEENMGPASQDNEVDSDPAADVKDAAKGEKIDNSGGPEREADVSIENASPPEKKEPIEKQEPIKNAGPEENSEPFGNVELSESNEPIDEVEDMNGDDPSLFESVNLGSNKKNNLFRDQGSNSDDQGAETSKLPPVRGALELTTEDQKDIEGLNEKDDQSVQNSGMEDASEDRLTNMANKSMSESTLEETQPAQQSPFTPHRPSGSARLRGQRPGSRQITGSGAKQQEQQHNNAKPEYSDRHPQSDRPFSRQIPKSPAVPADPNAIVRNRQARNGPDPWDGLDNTQNLEEPEELDPVVKNSSEFMGILNIFGEYVLRALLSTKNWKLRHAALRKMRRDVSQMPSAGEFSGAVVECVTKVLEVCSFQAVSVIHSEAFALFNDTIEAGKKVIENAALVHSNSKSKDQERHEGDVADTESSEKSSSGLHFSHDHACVQVKTFARAQVARLGDSNERVATMAEQFLDVVCENSLGFLGPAVVVPLLREIPEEGKMHSWKHILGRLNYVQLLAARYEFKAAGAMTSRDIVSTLKAFDAGMHPHASVRDQAKLLCGIVIEHENEVEKHLSDRSNTSGHSKDGRTYPPGHRARAMLEPFLDTLHGERREEFEEDLFGSEPIRKYYIEPAEEEGSEVGNNGKRRKKNNNKEKRKSDALKRKRKGKGRRPSKTNEANNPKPPSEEVPPKLSAADFGFGSNNNEATRTMITVGFREGSLGMKLKPLSKGKGAVISFLEPDGLAAKTDKLQIGDRLVKIAGVRVDQKLMKDIITKIKDEKRPCKFTFSRAK